MRPILTAAMPRGAVGSIWLFDSSSIRGLLGGRQIRDVAVSQPARFGCPTLAHQSVARSVAWFPLLVTSVDPAAGSIAGRRGQGWIARPGVLLRWSVSRLSNTEFSGEAPSAARPRPLQ